MIKFFNLKSLVHNENEQNFYNLLHANSVCCKKWIDGQLMICYREEYKLEVEKYFGIKIKKDLSLIEAIKEIYVVSSCINRYLKITNNWEISISECIKKIENSDKDKIEWYEERIYNSFNAQDELNKIIKE